MLEHLETIEVTGSAATSVQFTGLTLADRAGFLLTSRIDTPAAGTQDFRLFINGDTTLANYTKQSFASSGGSASAARTTGDTNVLRLLSGGEGVGHCLIQTTPAGWATFLAEYLRDHQASTILWGYDRVVKTDSVVADITSLTITSSAASGIAIGSVFDLYALGRTP
jgi:hypothetical protein